MAVKSPDARRRGIEALHPTWVPRTLSQHLDHVANHFADLPLVITDARSYSYSDMVEWSAELAAGLVNAGIRPGDHVALLMGNHPEFVALKFAIARVGAVAVGGTHAPQPPAQTECSLYRPLRQPCRPHTGEHGVEYVC